MTGCILLVRHGETEWNLERRIQGRFDSPLTARGVAQAYAIGRLIEELPDAASARIVASPLGRARRTADIIHERLAAEPELTIDDRLREISAGAWDGLTFRDIELRSPGIFDGDGRWEWNFRAPGGETYDAFARRVGEWLDESVGAPFIIAVTHGVVSRVLRGLYVGLPREVALTLPVPQDKVFRLSAGSIEELDAGMPDACSPQCGGPRWSFTAQQIGPVRVTTPEPITIRRVGRSFQAPKSIIKSADQCGVERDRAGRARGPVRPGKIVRRRPGTSVRPTELDSDDDDHLAATMRPKA